jgi:RND family efflux transporter MFP subunit
LEAQVTQLERERDAVSASLQAADAERNAAVSDRDLRIKERLDLDSARAGLLVAKAEVGRAAADRDTAALALDRCTVVSPIDGVVIERIASPGSTIQFANGQHGAHVVHLYDPTMLQVRADIPLAEAAKVGVGQSAEIIVDLLPDTVFQGVITRFVHRADLSKNTIEAKVHIIDPSPLLKPDMLARVRILPSQDERKDGVRRTVNRIFAPESAFDPKGAILVVDERSGNEGVAARRSVEVGEARVDGWVEIRSGLRPGDAVILDPTIKMGTAIRFREPDSSNGADT